MNALFKRLVLASAALIASVTISAQATKMVSLDSSGIQGDCCVQEPDLAVASGGRYVAFGSNATNLVPAGTNGYVQIFVHDLLSATTTLESVDSAGIQGNADSRGPALSADGRFVVFSSSASNLIAGDTNGTLDIFVRDRQSGTTERVCVQGNGQSSRGAISGDGRYVAFVSHATNLVSGDTNGWADIFVCDRQSGATERVSVATGGNQGNGESLLAALSADGRFVAFQSHASNLVSGDTNAEDDIFVRDRLGGTTTRVSVGSAGAQANGYSEDPSISADGRRVAFSSLADNLVSADTNASDDMFVRDLQAGTTTRVSVRSDGRQGNGPSGGGALSADGLHVAFASGATNLVSGDTNGWQDIFVHDLQSALTSRVSVGPNGLQANSGSRSSPALSFDGREVAFNSFASNLVTGDANGTTLDSFVHDRGCPGASASFRNAGSNPVSFTCNAPVLGTNWAGTVDLSTTGHSSAYLYAFAAQTTSTLPQGQVLLGSGQLARFGPVAGALVGFSFAVPNDTALCGLHLTTQALHLGTMRPFATSNAMDLVVGL